MKQFVKSTLGISAIILFLGLVYAGLNKAQSDEIFPPDLLRVQPVPVYCGNSYNVLLTTMNTFNMLFLGSSDVTAQGQPDGQFLGTMSMWYNTDTRKGVFYLTLPQTNETCLLSYGINWNFNTELLLDIVNTSLANASKLPEKVE
jgi:hypothetical protein